MEKHWSPYNRIARPEECHQVMTPEAYEAKQFEVIQDAMTKRPSMNWRLPFEADAEGAQALVSGGRWVVQCTACNNYPVYDPLWHVARCLECGAVYRLTPPNDWQIAEAILMARPVIFARHWTPSTQRIVDLIDENVAAGDPVGLDDITIAQWRSRDDANVIGARTVQADTPMVRSLVFVDDNATPHILHDGVVVTAEIDAEVFPVAMSEDTQAQAETIIAALKTAGVSVSIEKGDA